MIYLTRIVVKLNAKVVMGVDVMFGFVKGYSYNQLSLKKLQKNQYVLAKELEQQVDYDELINHMKDVLLENGIVYLITRKKIIYGVAVIEYEKHRAYEFTEFETIQKEKNEIFERISEKIVDIGEKELSFAENKKDVANAYVLKEFYLVDELQSNKETIRYDFIEQLKEKAVIDHLGVKVIVWEDDMIIDKTIGRCKLPFAVICAIIGIALGILLSFVFDKSLRIVLLLCITLITLEFGYTNRKKVRRNQNAIKE